MSKLRFTFTVDVEFDPLAYPHLEQQAVEQGRSLIDVAAEWEQENCDPSYLVEICDNLKQSVTVLPERKQHELRL